MPLPNSVDGAMPKWRSKQQITECLALKSSCFYVFSSVCINYKQNFNNMNSKYVIIRELGEGYFGKVFLTKEKKTGEEFAMKIFKSVSRICLALL